MSIKIQILLIIILLFGFILIVNMVRKRMLELKYVLAWLFCDIVLLVFTCNPNSIGAVARFLGIQSPMNMIFFLGFLFSIIIIFTLTVALSRVTERVRRLAQVIALEEEKKERLNKEDKGK